MRKKHMRQKNTCLRQKKLWGRKNTYLQRKKAAAFVILVSWAVTARKPWQEYFDIILSQYAISSPLFPSQHGVTYCGLSKRRVWRRNQSWVTYVGQSILSNCRLHAVKPVASRGSPTLAHQGQLLRRFSGPRIGSVGGSRFVDDLVLWQADCTSVAAWTQLKVAFYYFVSSGGLIACC